MDPVASRLLIMIYDHSNVSHNSNNSVDGAFIDSYFTSFAEFFLIFLYSLVAIVGFSSNILMITSLLISPALISQPCYCRFFLLMISDLLMCIFCLPFTLIILIRREWTLGGPACLLIPFFQSVAAITNTLTTALISTDRLFLVTQNSINQNQGNSSHALWRPLAIETAVIWISAIAVSIPIPFYQDHVKVLNLQTNTTMKCIELWSSGHLKGMYLFVNMLFQFLIPAAILLATYFKITRHLSQSHNDRSEEYIPTYTYRNDSNADSPTLSTSHNSPIQEPQGNRDRNVSRILLSIVACFITTWGPWHFFIIYLNYISTLAAEETNVRMLIALLYLLFMMTISVNALLYGWINPHIRQKASKALSFLKICWRSC